MPCRVLLADDHQIVRQGLRSLLEKAGYDVVAEAADGSEAVRLTRRESPDVVVLDLSMPRLNGVDAAQEIARADPQMKSILLTMYPDKEYVMRALRAGIKGYVLKTQAADDLVAAIRSVMNGQAYISPSIADTVVNACLADRDQDVRDPLSRRERQVLQLVAEGHTTKEVARLLHISDKTVETHRHNIMKKLDIHEVTGLVRYAIGQGLLRP
jgi:DNA-binding NarL/FixJ family response regulator